jgi:aminopeptidase N
MEDWGLISYSENSVLFDPARSSPETERGVFITVAHEISHQWFGNLVTAASWDEIWLNEAFATWMADKAMVRFNPLWHADLERRLHEVLGVPRERPGRRRARAGPAHQRDGDEQVRLFDSINLHQGRRGAGHARNSGWARSSFALVSRRHARAQVLERNRW